MRIAFLGLLTASAFRQYIVKRVAAQEFRLAAQFFFNAEQLVVFRDTVAARR
jgi:hypothetical protein